jgi:hypothetical protein
VSVTPGVVVALTQTTVGWLLVAAAALTFIVGLASRALIGRRRESKAVRSLVHTVRRTGVARVLFGRLKATCSTMTNSTA